MQAFFSIEYALFVLALLVSIYIGIKEGFKLKNGILIAIVLSVIGVNALDHFSVFKTDFVLTKKFEIRNWVLLLEIALYQLLYISLIVKRRYRLFLTIYLLLYILIVVSVSKSVQPVQSFYPTYSFIFGSLGVLIGILLFFYEKLNETQAENIFKNFWFWISTGLFIFLATEIPIMSLLNYLLQKREVVIEQVLPIMTVKQIISSFYYLTYLVGVLCRTKT